MSSGKLKAQYNRVRTSTALQANSMWTTTIGVEQDQAGSNAAIEATLRAPQRGGGGREARRQAAQELIEAAGYQATVTSFEDLVALARSKNIGGEKRGACKICGGLGHLTKQCRNQPAPESKTGAGAGGLIPVMQLIPPDAGEEDSMSSLSGLSSSSDSESDSGNSEERRRKRRKKSGSSSGKEEKKSKHKKERSKHKKHKKSSSSGKEKRHKKSSKEKKRNHRDE